METEAAAREICARGFGDKDLNNGGNLGHGFSFSTIAAAFTADQKALSWHIVCLINPGNPFPATENPRGEESLQGAGCLAGYQSHFSIGNGRPLLPFLPKMFNSFTLFTSWCQIVTSDDMPVRPNADLSATSKKIVVFDNSHILPLFIVNV